MNKGPGDLPMNNPGCLRMAVAGPILVLVAPLAALIRSISRRRRGSDLRLVRRDGSLTGFTEERFSRVRLEVDVPSGRDVSRILTEGVVRLAEGTKGAAGYHLLRREAGSEEAVVVSFGSSVQEFAERFLITCRRSAHQDHLVLWVALPRDLSIGEFVDPVSYDPEAEGEPEGLLKSAPLHWAVALRRRSTQVSIVYSLDFIVPEAARASVDRLEKALSQG